MPDCEDILRRLLAALRSNDTVRVTQAPPSWSCPEGSIQIAFAELGSIMDEGDEFLKSRLTLDHKHREETRPMSTHTDEFMGQAATLKSAIVEAARKEGLSTPENEVTLGAALDMFFGLALNLERIATALEGIEMNTRGSA